jgi:hypothetical protein
MTVSIVATDFAEVPRNKCTSKRAEYVSTLSIEGRSRLRDAIRLAYLDGDIDGGRHDGTILQIAGSQFQPR